MLSGADLTLDRIPHLKDAAMGKYPPRFAIVHAPDQGTSPVVLQTALPADAASVAFAQELQRLQQREATGEVLVIRLRTHRVVLHQPLASGAMSGDPGGMSQERRPRREASLLSR